MSQREATRTQGREVVIVEAARTPIGRGHSAKGFFRDVHPNELLGTAYQAVIERAGIEPELVEDVVAGCVSQVGEQSNNIARNAWLQAGLPIGTPASTVDRQCGSGQQAVSFAAGLIAAGVHDVMIGAGVEHMGRVPMGSNVADEELGTPFPPELMERYELIPQGLSAELIAERWEIARSEQDELGLRSHRLAARATGEGRFDREIVPIEIDGDTVAADQGIRYDTSLEQLAALKPAFKEDGTVTAGNSSQISDGAAAVLLMAREKADELGLAAAREDLRRDDRRSRSRDHADRADPRDAAAARAQRHDDRRPRPDRDQRGIRLGRLRLAARARTGHGQGQRQRRRARARPPARVLGRAAA